MDFLSDFFAPIRERKKSALGFVPEGFDAEAVLATDHEIEGERGGLWHFFVVDPESCTRGDAGYLDGAANNGSGWGIKEAEEIGCGSSTSAQDNEQPQDEDDLSA